MFYNSHLHLHIMVDIV